MLLFFVLLVCFWLLTTAAAGLRPAWSYDDKWLPSILLQPHTDWPWPFKYITRKWFAFIGWPPRKLLGNATGHLDITEPGTWAITWPLFFTIRLKNGWHFRIGHRWDYVDGYFQESVALKKIFEK